jgi:hypothetical protein
MTDKTRHAIIPLADCDIYYLGLSIVIGVVPPLPSSPTIKLSLIRAQLQPISLDKLTRVRANIGQRLLHII